MSDAEFESVQQQYPPYFDPEDFDNPETFLRYLEEPGVISIGQDIEGDSEAERLAEEQAQRFGWDLGFLVIPKSDGRRTKFPVYRVSSETSVIGSDGSEYKFISPYPHAVNQDHLRLAEETVAARVDFKDLSEEQKRRLIMRFAFMTAAGEVYEITGNGGDIVDDES